MAPAFRPAARRLALGDAFDVPIAPADRPVTPVRDAGRSPFRAKPDEIETMRAAHGA